MNRTQSIGIALLLIFILTSVWYLLIKKNDFNVVITAKTSPGTIYRNVLDWNAGLNKEGISTKIIGESLFSNLVYLYEYDPYHLAMNWQIEQVNDSISRADIAINDLNNSVNTRIKKLIGISEIEQLVEQEFSGFNKVLVNHLKRFSVDIDGDTITTAAYVAYVSVSCHQNKKADHMIINSPYINSFLQENDIKVISHPFLEIVNWEKHTGQIKFNFCFPIKKNSNLPHHENIKYKTVPAKQAVKATYHGNYSFTDESWYALDQYLDKNHSKKKSYHIIEVFKENPHTAATKDNYWRADIYMMTE